MAIIFECVVECADPDATQRLLPAVENLTIPLSTGRIIRWTSGIARWHDPTGCAIVGGSRDLDPTGRVSDQEARETAELGMRLYHHLLTAPPFRFARVDWEASLIPGWDPHTFLEDGHLPVQCVLDDGWFQTLGAPQGFVPFRPGYWWTPFRGDSLHRIGNGEQPSLEPLFRDLFPTPSWR